MLKLQAELAQGEKPTLSRAMFLTRLRRKAHAESKEEDDMAVKHSNEISRRLFFHGPR